jgi:thioredoxin reductase
MQHDVIIVGGSYAGISAALPLARARRSVLIVDGGQRRNRFADHSHGLLGRDGWTPAAIADEAREQLKRYNTVGWRNGTALAARRTERGFAVELETGDAVEASRLVFATGVRDNVPDIPGLRERWGRSVFHCPYCHGYELDQGAIGVLATSPLALHQALMLPDWGPTTLFLNDVFEPEAAQSAALRARGTTVERGAVARVSGDRADVEMADGRVFQCQGLFIQAPTEPASPLAAQLGCAMEEGPMGFYVRTDAMKQTSVPGIFACGDVARAAGSVPLAVGDGAMAGAAAHRSLMFPDG